MIKRMPTDGQARPLVGTGVLVFQAGAVLLGLRRGSHGAGTWSPPGGHLEFGEEPIDCVRREALEEAGIHLDNIQFVGVTNDVFADEQRHYVTLFYSATLASGTPTVLEPAKCEAWRWWPWAALPDQLFLPLRHLRENGFIPPVTAKTSTAGGELTRVCVFCGSSTGARRAYLAQARSVGRLLASERIGLVYGGGRVGLMGAVADAALSAHGSVIGVIPEALVTAEAAHVGLADLRVVHSMHERKQLMADLADAFVALPGGFGTFDELFEIVTWAQLGFHAKPTDLLNIDGYFDPLLEMVEHAATEAFVAADHGRLLSVEVDTIDLLHRHR